MEMNRSFKSRFAAAVVLEDIFRDALNVNFDFNLDIPPVIDNKEQQPLTLALLQVWGSCNKLKGYERVTNFLRLVKSAIHPDSIMEFEEALLHSIAKYGNTLTPDEARKQLQRCINESGVYE
jgi:hypothetical protein